MRVLFVTYFFPPAFGAGVVRITKTLKYLTRLGHDVTVLTAGTPLFWSYEMDLAKEIPVEARVVKIDGLEITEIARSIGGLFAFWRSNESGSAVAGSSARAASRPGFLKQAILNCLCVPDEKIGWIVPALAKGFSELSKFRYDVILSTSPAITNHLVAMYLAKFSRVPWVAEFRDPWSEDPRLEGAYWPLRKRVNRFIEKKILSSADWVTTVSEPLIASFSKISPIMGKASVITNGFDEEDFSHITRTEGGPYRIVYTGNFYGENRNPGVFLTALESLISSGRLPRSETRVDIYGPEKPTYIEELVKARKLEGVVVHNGFTNYLDSLRHQRNAGLLLILLEGGETALGHLTAKFFEYLGSSRPILAVADPESALSKLIVRGNFGFVAAPWDTTAMQKALLEGYRIHQGGKPLVVDEKLKAEFTRARQTKKLSYLLERVVNLSKSKKRRVF
jgi:glycosyltransferase involved in cell wall biosynthesis